jgi:hypothetical protein
MKLALQIEAGQAWANKNYLRDLFEGIVLGKDVEYIGIAVCEKCTVTKDDFRHIAPRLYSLFKTLNPPSLKGFFIISY